jgi:hypothetical protein
MSLQTMKNKITNNYMGVSISGRAPGGIWVTQGPFRNNAKSVINTNNNGFSLNGGHRNIGRVGQTWLFSKNFTPYRGAYARGNGGCCGTYYQREQVFPSREVDTRGNQYLYIKPSSLSTKGMLEKKYNYIWNGQYPCNIVSPEGNNNLLNATIGVYIHDQTSANMCVTGTNPISTTTNDAINIYDGFGKCKSKCSESVKTLYAPYAASQYTTIVQKKCANPALWQRPIPGPKNGDTLWAIDLSIPTSTAIPTKTTVEKCNIINTII